MQDAAAALDHLLIGSPTLEVGIDWLEARTGFRAARGGSHPGLGTWNAIASMGPRQYIEIIAPDPAQPAIETFYVPGLRALREPRVVTWAAAGVDLTGLFRASLPGDFSCDPPRKGSRVRPDGTKLAWTLSFPKHRVHGAFDGALPFLIEWDSYGLHPGKSSPPGLTLRAMRFRHPHPEILRGALASMGIEGVVDHADKPSIRVELESPRGMVVVE